MRRLLIVGCLAVAACSAPPGSGGGAGSRPSHATDRTLDLAINGDGYFIVQTPAGGFLFTRRGAMNVATSGEIVNDDGYRLYPPVGVPAGNTTLSIDGRGVVRLQPTDGPSDVVGQVVLARFERPGALERDGLYSMPTAGSGDPITGKPGSHGLGTVMTGRLEDGAP